MTSPTKPNVRYSDMDMELLGIGTIKQLPKKKSWDWYIISGILMSVCAYGVAGYFVYKAFVMVLG